ncbi:MAG TPA: cytochrome c [Methylomirabilota bacterium]|nr:cytochrome c [Methylomirabilota bacterium]
MRLGYALLALVAVLAAACGQTPGDPLVERGRQVYQAQCTQCHNPEPSQNGAVGPAVKGASRELLEAKILRGAYPPGYKPKRPTAVMPPQPAVAPEIPTLAAYLK